MLGRRFAVQQTSNKDEDKRGKRDEEQEVVISSHSTCIDIGA